MNMTIAKPQGRFRWKSIVILFVCFAVLSIGWFFLHRFQMRSIHVRFLEQAEQYEKSGDAKKATQFLEKYLQIKRDDVNVRARYGVLLETMVPPNLNAALAVYKGVVEQDQTRSDIRKRLAKIYYLWVSQRGMDKVTRQKEIDTALGHLDVLQKADAGDPEVQLLLADFKWLKKATREADDDQQEKLLKEAEGHYRAAISQAPHKLEAYSRLAGLLRSEPLLTDKTSASTKRNSAEEVTKVLDNLIAANSQANRAYLIRAAFRQAGYDQGFAGPAKAGSPAILPPLWGVAPAKLVALMRSPGGQGHFHAAATLYAKTVVDLHGAGQDLAQARKIAPDDVDVLLTSASHEMLRARVNGQIDPTSPHLEEARIHLGRADQLYPKDARILPQRANLEFAAQKDDEGLQILETAQKKASGQSRMLRLLELADLYIDKGGVARANELIEEMRKGGVSSHRLNFLRGRIAIKEGHWHEAIEKLDMARSFLAENPGLVMATDLFLGLCYEQLANPEQALAIYGRARKRDPLNAGARLGMVNALLALGRLDEAIDECQSLRQLPQVQGKATFLYARLSVLKNLNQPKARWDEVTALLKAVKDANPRSLEIDVLMAEVEVAQGKLVDAQMILERAKETSPQDVEPWIALAGLAARGGSDKGIAEALQRLEQAKAKFGDVPELRLAKLRYLPSKKEEALEFLRPLAENLDRFDPLNRGRLLAGLAEAFERAGAFAEAEKSWQELCRLEPNQFKARLALFDLYLRTKNLDGLVTTMEAIKEIEGADGPFCNYAKAWSLILRAQEAEKQRPAEASKLLVEARRYLDAAAAKRPRWSRIPEAMAAIAGLEGKADLALEHLQKAMDLGSRQLPVVRAVVVRLMESRKFAEADEVLRKLQQVAPITDDLQKLAAQISIFNQDKERAFELTEKLDSKDYKDYLWKGQMLGVLGKYKEAEPSLKRATELAGEIPEPWVALVQLQAVAGDLDKAKATIQGMRKKIPASQLAFALAQCYQAVDEKPMAEKAFHEALNAQPNNLLVLQSVVQFHLANNKGKAEPFLRQLLDPNKSWVNFEGREAKASEETLFWARRQLAMSLGFQTDSEKQREAMTLVGENLKQRPASVDDQVARGMLLTVKAEGRQEAIRILANAFKLKDPTPEQMFLLANLYETEWDWAKARSYLQELLSKHAKNEKYPDYLATFINKLLLHDDLDGAQVWLPKLQQSNPHSFLTVDCLVRYRAKSNSGEILPPIKRFLESKESKTSAMTRLQQASGLLSDLARLYPDLMTKKTLLESEKMLRSFAGQAGTKEGLLPVASFLGSCQRLEESLDLCEKLLKDLPAEKVVPVAVMAVGMNSKTSPKQFARVEAWVKSVQQQKPDRVEWDVLLASVKERQASYPEAESLYRKVLKVNPNNPVALNNLAYLLGLEGKGDEALRLIQKVVDAMVGLNGEVLDTRAVIYLKQGKSREAQKDLVEAIRQQKTPHRLFHLAQVYHSAGDERKTIETFGEAIRLGLREDMLHLLEREAYQDLMRFYRQSR